MSVDQAYATLLKENRELEKENAELKAQLDQADAGRRFGSKSKKRKQASAEIAKIPPALASWIAKCFKPQAELCRLE